MKKMLYTFCLLIFFSGEFSAQNSTFIISPGVERARDYFMEKKLEKPYVRGWRIVVGITRDRSELDGMVRKFKRAFPQRPVNWVYSEPFYRIITGAYFDRWDTLPTLLKIRREFPGAFEMNADIEYEEFLNWREYEN